MVKTTSAENYPYKVNSSFSKLMGMVTVGVTVLTLSGQSEIPYITLGIMLLTTCTSIFLHFKKKNSTVISILLLFGLSNLVIKVLTDTNMALPATIILLCFTTLYLNKIYLLSIGVIFNAAFIITQLTTSSYDSQGFFRALVCLELAIICLFFVCLWGSELINSTLQKEKETKSLLNNLGNAVNGIQSSTSALNLSIEACNTNVSSSKELSNSMAITVQEVTKGVVEQAENLEQISIMMTNADKKVSEISVFSGKLSDVSKSTNEIVKDGLIRIHEMERQMDTINTSVTESFQTVQELSKNIEEVNSFLSGISAIATQTNLLALNAAIEAARAGDSGRGFAVVADEVRKLAEQSANTVEQVNKVINTIHIKTQSVLDKVSLGSTATQKGHSINELVTESFERIANSFQDIEQYITEEHVMIENISTIFNNVKQQSENIASISEEHSAATEEMLATVENQTDSVESIANTIYEIKNQSEELIKLAANINQ